MTPAGAVSIYTEWAADERALRVRTEQRWRQIYTPKPDPTERCELVGRMPGQPFWRSLGIFSSMFAEGLMHTYSTDWPREMERAVIPARKVGVYV